MLCAFFRQTLFVAPSNEMDDEPVIVKVLSCDSVTQVCVFLTHRVVLRVIRFTCELYSVLAQNKTTPGVCNSI